MCAFDSISVPCVECTKSWKNLSTLTCRLRVAIARECRLEVTSHYSPLRQRCVYHCPEKEGDLLLQIMPLRRGLMHIDYADAHIVMCFGL